ncbi:hypothetical protein HAX54_045937 [Datura stramonium]|uniref:Uncharacterized protein n=1 Tax=Datura stramonium TaxID=4076 RepID=A0ABS8WIV8_DATST|nr:hypothetical protein [Datura stramonium]
MSNTGGGRRSSYVFTTSNIEGRPTFIIHSQCRISEEVDVHHSFTTSNIGGGRRSLFIHNVEYRRTPMIHHSLQCQMPEGQCSYSFITSNTGEDRSVSSFITTSNIEGGQCSSLILASELSEEPAFIIHSQCRIPEEAGVHHHL